MVAEPACRHDPKRSDGRKRSRLGAPQGVFAVAVSDDLAVATAGQVVTACEHIAGIADFAAALIARVLVPRIKTHRKTTDK